MNSLGSPALEVKERQKVYSECFDELLVVFVYMLLDRKTVLKAVVIWGINSVYGDVGCGFDASRKVVSCGNGMLIWKNIGN